MFSVIIAGEVIWVSSLGLLYCVLTAVSWAVGPVFLRKSLDTFDKTELNATRCVGFFFVSFLICLLANPSFLTWKLGLPLLGLLVCITFIGNFVGDLCYFVAIDNIGVGRAVSTANCYPVIVAAASAFFLDEVLTFRLVIGTAIIIAGLALLNLKKSGASDPDGGKNLRGFLMALVAAFCWATMLLVQKWLIKNYPLEPATMTFWRAAIMLLISWTYWFVRKNRAQRAHLFTISVHKWISPMIAGSFGLALGGFTFALALQLVPVSTATPITAANPIIAALIAKFMFGEKLSFMQWMGILLVIIGGVEVSA